MAAPNLFRPASVTAKNAKAAITTSSTAIISNAAESGKTLRVTSLYISNIDGTDSAAVTVDIFDGTHARHLAKTVAVPADATLTVITREDAVYLTEGDSLRLSASAENDLEAVASYEEIA
jgi:phosphotransferase system HPr-like phosphotransfer protein